MRILVLESFKGHAELRQRRTIVYHHEDDEAWYGWRLAGPPSGDLVAFPKIVWELTAEFRTGEDI